MGVINALVDLLAHYASWWHYAAIGLILQLPLPFYITTILIFGGLSYLLIWRFWHTRWHCPPLLLAFVVPILGLLRPFVAASATQSSVLLSHTPFLARPRE